MFLLSRGGQINQAAPVKFDVFIAFDKFVVDAQRTLDQLDVNLIGPLEYGQPGRLAGRAAAQEILFQQDDILNTGLG